MLITSCFTYLDKLSAWLRSEACVCVLCMPSIIYYTENIQFILIFLSVHANGRFNGLVALICVPSSGKGQL